LKYTTCPQENFPASCPKKLIHTLHEFWLEGDSFEKTCAASTERNGARMKERKNVSRAVGNFLRTQDCLLRGDNKAYQAISQWVWPNMFNPQSG
jgi:hypothetical protein